LQEGCRAPDPGGGPFEADTDVAAFECAWHEGRTDEAVALRGAALLDGSGAAANPA